MDKTYSKDEAVSLIKEKALEEEEMEKGKGSKGKGSKGSKSSSKGYSKTKREAPKQDKPKDKPKEARPSDVQNAFNTDQRNFVMTIDKAMRAGQTSVMYNGLLYPVRYSMNVIQQLMAQQKGKQQQKP